MANFDDSQRKLFLIVTGGLVGCLVIWGFLFRSSEAYVSGLVTLEGAPVNGAQVVFLSEDDKNSSTTIAVTNADGRYQLIGNAGPGMALGKYRVAVTKTALKDGSVPPGEELETARENGLLQNQLPAIYEDRTTTPLRAELVSGSNTVNLDLKKSP